MEVEMGGGQRNTGRQEAGWRDLCLLAPLTLSAPALLFYQMQVQLPLLPSRMTKRESSLAGGTSHAAHFHFLWLWKADDE